MKESGKNISSDKRLPDNLRSGLENLSGIDLSDVSVYRNSEKLHTMQLKKSDNIHQEDKVIQRATETVMKVSSSNTELIAQLCKLGYIIMDRCPKEYIDGIIKAYETHNTS